MSKRSPVSLEIKLHIVQQCLDHRSNPNAEAKQIGVSQNSVKDWIRKYKAQGLDGLKESKTWKTYARELKLDAVQDVVSGRLSLTAATEKYHISSRSVLSKWMTKYTGKIECKPAGQGKGRSPMNKGRKTTLEERIEIAQYTLAHDLDYSKAMEKFGVSYPQVYAWVRKYQAGQDGALQDGRGRKKPVEELDEQAQLKLRIKELEARNEYLEMENAFAKKLAEIERRKPR
ncbi:helix-turn-helix domain-containing protein [Paenibacillus xylanexedens]|uniref:helix-turn-helix domain-containing protein n=1 Tax=Paenibacillus xylanexedens TaxID=528191 RepID=UPI0016426B17|nr:helix-turn-helix domain-containing protein [Paenibacillus xylanexedens]